MFINPHDWLHPHISLDYNRLYACDRIPREDSNMSIAVAIVGRDGMVFGVDDMVYTSSSTIRKHYNGAQKLWPLQGKFALLAINDDKGVSDWIISEYERFCESHGKGMRHYVSERACKLPLDIYENVLITFAEHVRGFFRSFEIDATKERTMSFTIAGYDSKGKPRIGHLYSRRSFVPKIESGYRITCDSGTGEYYVEKLKDYLFKTVNSKLVPIASIETLKRLTAFIIIETAKVNEDVSNRPYIFTLTEKDGIKPIKKCELDRVLEYIEPITNDKQLLAILGMK